MCGDVIIEVEKISIFAFRSRKMFLTSIADFGNIGLAWVAAWPVGLRGARAVVVGCVPLWGHVNATGG